jgi:hypothetical protein
MTVRTINARNVNEAYVLGLRLLAQEGSIEASRAGPVKTMPCPVTTTYRRPYERVLLDTRRDANPYFHLMESLWMLAGRNDVAWLEQFNGRISEYSDNGSTFHGAYGYRWRSHFDKDQLTEIITLLRKDPNTRRAIVGMWDPRTDCNADGKDFPCNMQIAFRLRPHGLDMTVYNRSNDIIWGAYGANAVHMSFLQEWMAAQIGAKIGQYHQVSNDFHAYIDVLHKVGIPDPACYDPYEAGEISSLYLVDKPEQWNKELMSFIENPLDLGFTEQFFCGVARPMTQAWWSYKKKDYRTAQKHNENIQAPDWRRACHEWINRRHEKSTTRRSSEAVAHVADDIRPKRS